MARVNYSRESNPETSSRAMGYELHISPKHSREICAAIKNMRTPVAKQYLADVAVLKRAVPFKRYNDGVGHRRGKMAAGRYPVRASTELLKVLVNAENSAMDKGLEPGRMKISHAATKQGRTIRGIIARAMGRATAKNTETVTVEIILEEL
ncbi:MAG: 50S ribosomal protein L22 [ANME-2 cluster archaeon]|jgi:large subunit ribosomal protein L22|nr:MAG: 50S ribosomal protein L22 [ANME-2 cluster archaeon]